MTHVNVSDDHTLQLMSDSSWSFTWQRSGAGHAVSWL